MLIQVEFSDESDSEASTQAKSKEQIDVPKRRTTARKTAYKGKTAPDPPAEKVPPKRQTKKSSALPRAIASDDDETLVCQHASKRRGRTRGELSRKETDFVDEPDTMRTIEEENNQVLNLSIEQLRTSDTETEDDPASSKDIVFLYFVISK